MPLLPESFLTDTNGSLVRPLLLLTSDNCSLTQDHPCVCSKAQPSSPISVSNHSSCCGFFSNQNSKQIIFSENALSVFLHFISSFYNNNKKNPKWNDFLRQSILIPLLSAGTTFLSYHQDPFSCKHLWLAF